MLQFLEPPTVSIFTHKFLSQMPDHLLAIFRAGVVKYVFLNSHADTPIHTTCFGINKYCHTITRIFNYGTHVII